MMNKTVIAIGEVLWDVFPTGKKPGGSSMNVALNLHKQGIQSELISAVGEDNYGKELLAFLHSQKFPTSLIQQSRLPTSSVNVLLDSQHQASYTIAEPVAWDDLQVNENAIEAVKNADALVYCSLTCRNETSRNTVLAVLKVAKLKVFDINLRAPFYTIETLKMLLAQADILKVNEHELTYLKQHLNLIEGDDEQLLYQLSNSYNISIICLTLGEKGAKAVHNNSVYSHQGYPAKVLDTVGAGDSFLATFIASYLKGYSIDEMLDRSCKVGAYVATQEGANPAYDEGIFS